MKTVTKIFLDSCDSQETKQALSIYPDLAGQTTNPSLLAKNVRLLNEVKNGRISEDRLWWFYEVELKAIRDLLPNGLISAEVNINQQSNLDQIRQQISRIVNWNLDLYVKLPIIENVLILAPELIAQGIKLNFTLCFSESQAAAVYKATTGARPGQVLISPFLGRLDDSGYRGLDLLANILKLYKDSDQHVQVLAASLRQPEQLSSVLEMQPNFVTVPFSLVRSEFDFNQALSSKLTAGLQAIPFQGIDLNTPLANLNIHHPLTTSGLERFVNDWQRLIKSVV